MSNSGDAEVVFSTPRFEVLRRSLADGDRYTIRKPDAVSIAVERKDRYLLLDIRRDGAARPSVEFPGGRIEPGESPTQAAARELLEEVGLDGVELEPIAAVRPLPGMVSETVYVFRARVDEHAQIGGVVGHEGIEAWRWADAAALQRLCAEGRIDSAVDGYIALLLACCRR